MDYFNYVLEFVEKQYDHILDEPEYLFYQSFRNLTEDAKCLYLRFSNRTGDFFRIGKISYEEINDVHAAKEELIHHEFIQVNESADLSQFRLFTKSELLNHFEFLEGSSKKEEMLQELSELDIPTIHEWEEIAEVQKNGEVEFIKLLFFGHRGGRMTDFVIRDVGNVKIEKVDETQFKPWFGSRDEALSVLHVSKLRRLIYELQEAEIPLEEFVLDLPWEEWLKYPRSSKSAEKLLLKIAYHFEQMGEPTQALKHYAYTTKHPARERTIRLLDKKGDSDTAIQLAQEIIENPSNATELTFATDFLNRSGIRINRSMTERLKTAPSIAIFKDPALKVEQGVLTYFQKEGWEGIHAENYLWRGIFGLAFWVEMFDASHGSFHHPLQRQPSDLNDTAFFESRVHLLQDRLDGFKTRKKLLDYLTEMHHSKEGMANRFVTWHETLLPAIEVAIIKLPFKGLKKVLIEMAKNMKENSAGFPDLFLWNEKSYQFYEVKSPNDHLSAQQLFWLDFLKQQKINTEILRVNYLS